jgi:hypothetical protein
LSAVFHWLFYSVALALLPVGLSWLFLPAGDGVGVALSRGELAVLAAALASTGLGEIIREHDRIVGFERLVALNVGALLAAFLVMTALLGASPKLSQHDAIVASAWLLAVTVCIGARSVARTEDARTED